MEKKNVCIIGGGPAGLVSLRRVLDSSFLTGTIFEHKDDIGGKWYYKKGEKSFPISQKLSDKQSGVEVGVANPEWTTVMYDDLECNTPYPMTEFAGFPHVPSIPSKTFLKQHEVHEYLVKYAGNFNLWPHIQLNTSVISVWPEVPISSENLGQCGRWIVETHNHKEDIYTTTVFDAVMVCIGKDDYPYQSSDIPGLEKFKGDVLHSKYFKSPDDFQDKSVVLIGFGPSSADLALHLSTAARKVTICHKFPLGLGMGLVPKNVRETKAVKMITENGVITEEDENIPCDAIILCTGFGLKFPFFEEDAGIQVLEEKYVPNLYKLTIFTKRPSLAILNMVYRSVEFMIVEAQAKYFVACLEGVVRLPSYQEMEAAVMKEEEEKRGKGWPYSLWFQVGDFGVGAWKYFGEMLEEIPGAKEELCRNWPLMDSLVLNVLLKRLFGKLALYKSDRLRIVGENVWEWECSSDEKLFPGVEAERIRFTLERETGTVVVETEKM